MASRRAVEEGRPKEAHRIQCMQQILKLRLTPATKIAIDSGNHRISQEFSRTKPHPWMGSTCIETTHTAQLARLGAHPNPERQNLYFETCFPIWIKLRHGHDKKHPFQFGKNSRQQDTNQLLLNEVQRHRCMRVIRTRRSSTCDVGWKTSLHGSVIEMVKGLSLCRNRM